MAESRFLGRIRGTLKRELLLNPLLALLNRDLIQRVYIPKGPPNPIPYRYMSGLCCLADFKGTLVALGSAASGLTLAGQWTTPVVCDVSSTPLLGRENCAS